MAALKPGEDPYRILGVLRGADQDQIKAAHRRLAKRFHPDRATGDEQRFLAVQEAYQLLSDPAARREWDRRHAPVPSWGAERRPTSGRASADARTPAREGDPPRQRRARSRGSARPGRATPRPGQRTATWSAAHVPWWEEFRPRSPAADGSSEATGQSGPATRSRRGSRTARPADASATEAPSGPAAELFDLDAHSRSSGAAWSMAARRHFRRGDRDLPSRGAWRYRGTQVVTGAEARKLADEESARATARPPRKPAAEETARATARPHRPAQGDSDEPTP